MLPSRRVRLYAVGGLADGAIVPGNIDPYDRPVLHNPDGSASTTRSFSIPVGDGTTKEVLLPKIVNGQELSHEDAIDHYHKTGEHLGIFPDWQTADGYASQLHNDQARRMGIGQDAPTAPLSGTFGGARVPDVAKLLRRAAVMHAEAEHARRDALKGRGSKAKGYAKGGEVKDEEPPTPTLDALSSAIGAIGREGPGVFGRYLKGVGKGVYGSVQSMAQTALQLAPGSPTYSPLTPVNQSIATISRLYKGIRDDPKGMIDSAAQAASRTLQDPELLGEAASTLINPNKLAELGPLAKMTAYHGTPHVFEPHPDAPLGRFDLSKVGTGAGAQNYGHGIYVAENPSVAGQFAADIPDSVLKPINDRLAALSKVIDENSGPQYRSFKNDVGRKASEEYDKLMQERANYKGSLYHVDVPDEHVAKMIDLDKPLGEQPDHVQQIVMGHLDPLKKELRVYRSNPNNEFNGSETIWNTLDGQDLYKAISKTRGGDKAASEFLNSQGVPGLKYRDSTMRGFDNGTKNLVLFDPSISKIIYKQPENPVRWNPQDIPRADDLSPLHRQIETELVNRMTSDPEAMIARYKALPATMDGRVISVDEARELDPTYRADRSNSAAVHEPLSYLMKDYYAKELAKQAPPGLANRITFTGGGTGSGKTTAVRKVLANDDSQLIYDTNLGDFGRPSVNGDIGKGAVGKINQGLDAGKDVEINYVYAEPMQALHQALNRAMKMERNTPEHSGRTVPLAAHLETHIGSNNTIRQLIGHYSNEPRVKFNLIDNSHGAEAARLIPVSELPHIPHSEYNNLREQATKIIKDRLAEGSISPKVYEGFMQGE